MNSQVVSCPHCQSSVANDGKLAGVTVACPKCGGHFAMPPLATPGIPEPPPPPVMIRTQPAPLRPLPRRHRSSMVLWLSMVIAMAVVAAFLGFVLLQEPQLKQAQLAAQPKQETTAGRATSAEKSSTVSNTTGGGTDAAQEPRKSVGKTNPVSEDDAKKILTRVLNGWQLRQRPGEFSDENPDITSADVNLADTILRIPQNYRINACRTWLNSEGNPTFQFSVSLTYESSAGSGITKNVEYLLIHNNKNERPWLVSGSTKPPGSRDIPGLHPSPKN